MADILQRTARLSQIEIWWNPAEHIAEGVPACLIRVEISRPRDSSALQQIKQGGDERRDSRGRSGQAPGVEGADVSRRQARSRDAAPVGAPATRHFKPHCQAPNSGLCHGGSRILSSGFAPGHQPAPTRTGLRAPPIRIVRIAVPSPADCRWRGRGCHSQSTPTPHRRRPVPSTPSRNPPLGLRPLHCPPDE
jgi:hypothetical protein